MKATDLLKQQHEEVKALFEKLEASSRAATKRQLFEELAANLVAHDGIERELFYPACEENMGMTDLLGEALVEHCLVEFSLYQADEAQGQDDFDYKLTVLKEVLEHHIEEEEGDFFTKVNKALGKDKRRADPEHELSAGQRRGPGRGSVWRWILAGVSEGTAV